MSFDPVHVPRKRRELVRHDQSLRFDGTFD
jgi:hypothetical protein